MLIRSILTRLRRGLGSPAWPSRGPNTGSMSCRVDVLTPARIGGEDFYLLPGDRLRLVSADGTVKEVYEGLDGPDSAIVNAGDAIEWTPSPTGGGGTWRVCPWAQRGASA